MADGVDKVVLAYSGGLDTSVILRWLQDRYRCQVVTFTADLGQGEELEPARAKAELMGAAPIYIEDLRETFVADYVFPMFRANALYEGTYLLGTSIARPLIAKAPGRDRARGRRRCDRPRCDRQGQRPGPLRALRLRAQPEDQGDRALARVGPGLARGADRVRRAPSDPDPARQARRAALLTDANLLHISYEGRALEDPWREPDAAMFTAPWRPRRRPTRRPTSSSSSRGATRSRSTASGCRPRRCSRA